MRGSQVNSIQGSNAGARGAGFPRARVRTPNLPVRCYRAPNVIPRTVTLVKCRTDGLYPYSRLKLKSGAYCFSMTNEDKIQVRLHGKWFAVHRSRVNGDLFVVKRGSQFRAIPETQLKRGDWVVYLNENRFKSGIRND